MSKVAYQFVIPLDTEASMIALTSAISHIGKIIKSDKNTGYIKFKMRRNFGAFAVVFEGNVFSQDGISTMVRAIANEDNRKYTFTDQTFDMLINELSKSIKLDIVAGPPYIVNAQYVGGNTLQNISGKMQGANVGGAIVGSVLMGGAGAVVGGMSGNKKQHSTSKEEFSDYSLFLVRYSNGKMEEVRAKKNTSLYNEILVKLIQ